MTRWIVFDGAPTVAECYAAYCDPQLAQGSWHSLSVDVATSHHSTRLQRPPAPASPRDDSEDAARGHKRHKTDQLEPPTNVYDVTASQFHDAEEEVGVKAEADPVVVPSSNSEEDSLARARRRVRARSSSSPETDPKPEQDADEGVSRTSYMMPPPTQTRHYSEVHHPLQQSAPTAQPPYDVSFPFPPTAPLPDISHVTSAYTTDDSYAATGMAGDVSIGAPPFFGWQVYNIVPLNQLRKKLAKNSKGPPPKASVLAAVLSWEQQETSKGLITKVVLMDDMSQSVTLVLWKAAGVEITKAIRRGDIIYAEALKVSEFNKVLQLTFNERDSILGICWRTYVDDPDDEAYRFHHAWRGQMPQADAVLKQAEWFAKWSDRV